MGTSVKMKISTGDPRVLYVSVPGPVEKRPFGTIGGSEKMGPVAGSSEMTLKLYSRICLILSNLVKGLNDNLLITNTQIHSHNTRQFDHLHVRFKNFMSGQYPIRERNFGTA